MNYLVISKLCGQQQLKEMKLLRPNEEVKSVLAIERQYVGSDFCHELNGEFLREKVSRMQSYNNNL